MRRLTIALVLAVVAVFAVAGTAGTATNAKAVKLFAHLTGAAEVPGPGDPDGSGTARITIRGVSVCWELTAANIAPATAAHIHVGSPEVAGPVVVTLSPPTDGSSSGCTHVDPSLARAIKNHPQNYYVNVHNADFPAGAIRGQLQRR